MTTLDLRLHAFRPDLADRGLEGQVSAERFIDGTPARVAAPVVDLKSAPLADAGLDTQLLLGDAVRVFDRADGWAWVQAEADGYVGYVAAADLATGAERPTHVVVVPRTFVYSAPDMKMPRPAALSLGSRLAVRGEAETRGTRYAVLASGEAVVADHLAEIGAVAGDFVAVAETLLLTPYLWGGTSGFGIDCSGLVQLAMRMAGRPVLRDTDMQAASIGDAIEPGPDFSNLRRGDLVFWKGHVGIMMDGETLIHASGHAMMVSKEPLAAAVQRIGHLYGPPTGVRRP